MDYSPADDEDNCLDEDGRSVALEHQQWEDTNYGRSRCLDHRPGNVLKSMHELFLRAFDRNFDDFTMNYGLAIGELIMVRNVCLKDLILN